MKKVKLLSAVLLIGLLVACGSAQTRSLPVEPVAEAQVRQEHTLPPEAKEPSETVSSVSGQIAEEEAVSIALTDAGVLESDVTRLRVHLSLDDYLPEYEVEFYVGQQEYDYDIALSDGKILSRDYDIEDDGFSVESVQEAGDTLTEQEAIRIVLDKVPGASEKDLRIHRDWDDGRETYEGSLVYEKMEYDFEIDANNGTVIEWEKESVYD